MLHQLLQRPTLLKSQSRQFSQINTRSNPLKLIDSFHGSWFDQVRTWAANSVSVRTKENSFVFQGPPAVPAFMPMRPCITEGVYQLLVDGVPAQDVSGQIMARPVTCE